MRKIHVLSTILAATLCAHANAAPPVQSTFDTTSEGWDIVSVPNPPSGVAPTIAATYSVTYSPTGGNPGGYINELDPDGDDYYFRAPLKFLNNQSAALGGTLKFDLADLYPAGNNSPTLNTSESPLILVGSTESIYYADNSNITQSFQTYTFTLSAGHGGLVNSQNGAAATNADFAAVLSNLQGIYILGDYWNGGDTGELDNVFLNPAPEPTTTAMIGLCAAAGVVWLIKLRRQSATRAA